LTGKGSNSSSIDQPDEVMPTIEARLRRGVHNYAIEVRQLAYTLPNGVGEYHLLQLSERMIAAADEVAASEEAPFDVLGDQTYGSLARKGETMTTAAVATYAYDQIDQARTELEALSK
jgi:hypothetical protein